MTREKRVGAKPERVAPERGTWAHDAERAFRGLVVIRALGALADGTMLPFMVLWAVHSAGLSGYAAGLLFAAQAVGEMAGGLAAGVLSDRLGHRRVLVTSIAGMAVGYGSLFLVHQPVVAVTMFFVAGLFESAFHPTIAALIGDLKAGPDLHMAFGVARIGANVGHLAGPLLGAAVVAVSLSSVFALVAALLVAALVIAVATLPQDRPVAASPADGEPDASPTALKALFRDRRLGTLVLAGGLLAITLTWMEADGLVLLRDQRPLSTTAYATLFAIAAGVSIVFQIPTSRWARRHSSGRLLLIGASVQAAGLLALAAASSGYAVLVCAVVCIAVGQMVYGPALSAFVTTLAGRGRNATYQAAVSLTEDIGSALGPTTGLALGGLAGARQVWLAAGSLCLLGGLGAARAAGLPVRVRADAKATTAPDIAAPSEPG